MNILTKVALTAGAVLLVPLAQQCSATEDRASGNGYQPDTWADTSHVTVYRNADSVPNVATFCVEKQGFISTLSGGDDGTSKGSVLLRYPELDARCS